jgi:hypothetical protein
MSFLVRTRSGLFTLDEAHPIEQIEHDIVAALIPLRQILDRYAAYCVKDDTVIDEYLAGRTRRSRAAEQPHRNNKLAAARLLFVNSAETVALLSQPAGDGVEDNVCLFHLA